MCSNRLARALVYVSLFFFPAPPTVGAPAPLKKETRGSQTEFQVVCHCATPEGGSLRPGIRSLVKGEGVRIATPSWAKFLDVGMTPLNGFGAKGFAEPIDAIEAARNLPKTQLDKKQLQKAKGCQGYRAGLFYADEVEVKDAKQFLDDEKLFTRRILRSPINYEKTDLYTYTLKDKDETLKPTKGHVYDCKIVEIRRGEIVKSFAAEGKPETPLNDNSAVLHRHNGNGREHF